MENKYDITKKEAYELLSDENIKVLDVRTQTEIREDEPIVEDAFHIDIKSNDFKEKISKLSKEHSYLVTCSGGLRSHKACEIMASLGFEKLYNLKGGLKIFKDCNA